MAVSQERIMIPMYAGSVVSPHCTYYDIHEGMGSGGRGNGKHCVCQLSFNYIMIPVSIGNTVKTHK